MPQNYFITGEPKAGKTTLLKELIEALSKSGLKVGGFISPEERHHGTRTAFHVMDVESRKQEMLASVDGDGPKVSKYHVDVRAFESIAVPAMDHVDNYDVFVIDEIGRMELKSRKFIRLLDKVFESHTPVIATLHRDYVNRYGLSGEVIRLTVANRNSTYYSLLRKAKKSIRRRPKRRTRKKVVKTRPEAKKKAKKARRARMKRPRGAAKKPSEAPKKEKPKKGIIGKIKDLIGL